MRREALDWREPLWIAAWKPRDICLSPRGRPEISLNGRLPRTFQRVLGLAVCYADEESPNGTLERTSRAVVSGSRLFNTIFGIPRSGKNITGSLDTIQSGSPPAALRPFGDTPPGSWILAPGSFPLNSPPLHAIVCLLN